MSHNSNTSAIGMEGDPAIYIKSINTDVFRKDPVEPFVSQDEYRIVLFPSKYDNGDPNDPLKINVNPNHFYEYLKPSTNESASDRKQTLNF
jgi:hypothetical protein